jgi:putative membrane protein
MPLTEQEEREMLDLILEFIHHVAVFGLVGVAAAEFAMIAPGLGGSKLMRLAALDGVYGGLAGLIVIAGFARVFLGDAGSAFYLGNLVFWTKITLFVIVGLVSIRPTLVIQRWRRAAQADPNFAVSDEGVSQVRPWFLAEFALLAFIPIFAAMMARGIGL